MKRPRTSREDISAKRGQGDSAGRRSARPAGTSRDEKKPYSSDRIERKPYGAGRSDARSSFNPNRSDDRKPFGSDRGERKPYGGDRDRKPFGSDDRKSFGSDRAERKPYSGDRERKSFGSDERRSFGSDRGERKPYGAGRSDDRKPYGSDRGERKPYGAGRSDDRKPYGSDRGERKPYGERSDDRKSFGSDRGERKPYGAGRSDDRKPYGSDRGERKPYGEGRSDDRKSFGSDRGERKPYGAGRSDERKPYGSDRGERKPYGAGRSDERKSFGGDRERGGEERKSFGPKKFEGRKSDGRGRDFSERGYNEKQHPSKTFKDRGYRDRKPSGKKNEDLNSNTNPDEVRLNRYIANAGVCSRRKADELISLGEISVNGQVVTELGYKVHVSDTVHFNGQLLRREKMMYVLLNKPKDYITTTDDPRERKTVMDLVEKASRERIYPVGRLDRNTTGLLLLTNDGDLAEKLAHPKNQIPKIYHATLNKSFRKEDFEQLEAGIELEDGFIKPDDIAFVEGASKKEVGIQIHSGKNRIVRRIFEQMGYEVEKLDRVVYANLTKKDLPRGRWRHLTKEELLFIKRLVK
ncbi:pseudouridylate synthase [Solitalea longa]|uniref:Pseudouridine synthase n=1 Tax=Solitalea longa TaxID=2079460 RepID=A0A2S5A9N0_9SPHI|nr:pseudouridine synthase [Solitalea longa]POY39290.1 pseudouridylate synthase [Solitalea longa]